MTERDYLEKILDLMLKMTSKFYIYTIKIFFDCVRLLIVNINLHDITSLT